MLITVITLFPELFDKLFATSMLKRAEDKGTVKFNIVNLRDFGIGKHKSVDDRPYGGGAGMVLRVDVVAQAIKKSRLGSGHEIVVLLDPKGDVYDQKKAEEFSKIDHIILVCGHYEGFDERIRDYIDCEISMGDFVLSGGEIPAMAIADSIVRLIPGNLKKEDAASSESFSNIEGERLLEYPHYTRPSVFEGKTIPEDLLTGNLKKVQEYRHKEAINLTKKRRPDILTEK